MSAWIFRCWAMCANCSDVHLVERRTMQPVDEVVLPTGGKTRIYSRVMDLPVAQKPGPARQAAAWTPPVKFPSVFHYANGASL